MTYRRGFHAGRTVWALMYSAALALTAVGLPARAAPGENWNIDPNILALDPGNRFQGNLIAVNRGSSPVFVRATVTRVELDAAGQRVRASADNGALRVYPSEFALRPNEAFTVRLIADPASMRNNAESFYVKMVDVGEVGFSGLPSNSGSMAVLLGFEALVSVHRERAPRELPRGSLTLALDGNQTLLTNRSGRHIFLLDGYGCPSTSAVVVDCETIKAFPRQSLMPGESVVVKPAAAPFVAIAFQPHLSANAPRQLVYLPRPATP